MIENIERERYEAAKKRCVDYEKHIEDCLKVINSHQRFINEYENMHAIESEVIALFEKKMKIYALGV